MWIVKQQTKADNGKAKLHILKKMWMTAEQIPFCINSKM